MEIVVCIKRVVDVAQVKVDERTNEPIIQGIPEKTSDFDKNAMEAAINIKDKTGGNITVITLGTEAATENVKECLAMGGDKAIILNDPAWADLDTHNKAKVLSAAIKSVGDVDLVMMGEASIDSYSGTLAPRVAQMLDFGVVTSAKKVEADGGKITASKDFGSEIRNLEAATPVVVSVNKEINEPRLPNLMQILAAGNKPIETKDAAAIGFDNSSLNVGLTTKGLKAVSMERKKVVFEGDDAVDKLAGEIKSFLGV